MSYINTDINAGNIISFGDNSGTIPNNNYVFNKFVFETKLKINSNNGNAGVILRSKRVTNINDNGEYYYVGLSVGRDEIYLGETTGTTWNNLHTIETTIDVYMRYILTVEAIDNEYNIYLDSN